MEKKHDALKKYIENSVKREIIPNTFYVRMSREIAKNFDTGMYNDPIKDYSKTIKELDTLHIKYPSNAKPVFYLYIVPDENFIELLNFPISGAKKGGCPVKCYDLDGFNCALGESHSAINYKGLIRDLYHVQSVHEFAHFIHQQFGYNKLVFEEGFAELIPWYALDYEKIVPEHLNAIKSVDKIYTINDIVDNDTFKKLREEHKKPKEITSFSSVYISSYLCIRAIVENIRVKYDLSRVEAVQKFLELYRFTKFGGQWFIVELAEIIGMNVEKLLDSTDYQIAELNKIIKEVEQ